jgi:hypothetical protein
MEVPHGAYFVDRQARFFPNWPPMKMTASLVLITLSLICFGILPEAEAVSPPPDGAYPGGNTAEGQSAFSSLTSGTYNTAVGFFSLENIATSNFNTGIGAGTLLANTADNNTAIGAAIWISRRGGGKSESRSGRTRKEGKPYSVRYDQVNAMLLNEFLKAHQKLEEQGATIAKQQKQIEVLTTGLQKVSAQLEPRKAVPQTVMNNR